jgi:transmembrane sensor
MSSEKIADLIVKILTGEANDHEKENFHNWLAEDKSNHLYYQKIRILWERSKGAYNSVEFDEAAAKAKILSKIQHIQSKNRALKIRFWYSAAASILLLLGLAIYTTKLHDGRDIAFTSGNNIREIILPDSSHVWLNENSLLRTPEVFSAKQRNVVLEGEAYFEVFRDVNRPFKIKAGNTMIKVLGTSFDVKLEKANGNVSVNVNSGKVAFYKVNNLQGNNILTPGTSGQYIASENKIKISTQIDQNYLSWKTGILTFYDTPLDEVCRVLGEHYKKKVKAVTQDRNLTLTGSFQKEPLEDILKTIEITLDIEVTVSNGVILIHD